MFEKDTVQHLEVTDNLKNNPSWEAGNRHQQVLFLRCPPPVIAGLPRVAELFQGGVKPIAV